jgi:3-oxoacyl-[acyl-carrier protein] reductase
MRLAGKTALVTGGSRGIGRAIALALGREGAAVAVNCRAAEDAAAGVVAALRAQGGRAVAVRADVRDWQAVLRMAGTVQAELGPVDILVNNAGIVRDNLAAFMGAEEWSDVLDTSLRGAFHCIKALGKDMARRRWGRVINISSVAGLIGDMMRANYAAAKAGLLGLTRAVAREMAASGVTVNAIAPGAIETELLAAAAEARRRKLLDRIPQGRFGRPEEVAEAAVFLASEDAAYVTGCVLCVDGGMSIA